MSSILSLAGRFIILRNLVSTLSMNETDSAERRVYSLDVSTSTSMTESHAPGSPAPALESCIWFESNGTGCPVLAIDLASAQMPSKLALLRPLHGFSIPNFSLVSICRQFFPLHSLPASFSTSLASRVKSWKCWCWTNERRWFHSSRVKLPSVRMSASWFFGVNVFDLDLGVQVDPVGQPIKGNSVGPGNMSHCRASAFDDHLDDSFVVFKDVQHSSLIKRIRVWGNKIDFGHFKMSLRNWCVGLRIQSFLGCFTMQRVPPVPARCPVSDSILSAPHE